MSDISTGSLSMLQNLRYRIRPPSSLCTWCSVTSCSPVAEYNRTGTLTSPKATAPFQIARMVVTSVGRSWACRHPAAPRAAFHGQDGPVEPMLATPATGPAELPRGPEWAYEVKWDGVRALADTRSGRLRLWSRNEREITLAYPELTGLAAVPDAVLDGEIVLMADGIPSFSALADRMHVRDPRRADALAAQRPVTFLVFDVLRLDGVDLTRSSYDERRETLSRLALPDRVELSPVYPDGAELWGITKQLGLEGVVAKRRSSV